MADWSRWTTNPYYALVILIVACGSIPKGVCVQNTLNRMALDKSLTDCRLR